MPIKNGKVATFKDVWGAILKYNPFPSIEMSHLEIHLPKAYPNYKENLGREHRAYIQNNRTGAILITAGSAYELVEKIQNGFKYDPNRKEGLWE